MKSKPFEINYLDFLIPMGHVPGHQTGSKKQDALPVKDKLAKEKNHR
jgi:hypothetical protein